ncbi:recombinase family protein [Arthrobacter sp. ISL-65]|uniref:recombinase family protein n=1 Tax=Arthrobacter sp. ISL-65 TaxID=2819112 RepID=UPI001BE67D7B|nr:recombinase family protein [Arthrobacter sp. ISL-65]MBT2549803.1 recombinase family protein [Arthrobacter sp. ISL-65]
MSIRRCAIYARISVSAEESVSIARQLEATRQYAASRGWQVVAEFTDDGVSASRNKPEDRAGWRALLDSPEQYDAVIVWKIDRLARKVLDFLHAHEALRDRKAGIVAVEDPVDMTTAQGRAFATLLAVFGEMEAEATRARVKAARRFLVMTGRVPGGTLAYGWRSVPNPDGPGLVLAQDPHHIGFVRGAVERIQRGHSIYSTVQWLDEVGAPLPSASQKSRKRDGWSYTTVERLLRNPVLAGMTAYNPGNTTQTRGEDVLRDSETGLPVVDESIAIMTVSEWRTMVKSLDERDSAQALPRALRSTTSPLLSGLVSCGHCRDDSDEPVRMHRGTTQGRPGYSCRSCYQTITKFEDYVIEEFLRQKGERVRWSLVREVHEGAAAMLPEIEHRLSELTAQLQSTDDEEEADRITGQISNLRSMRREARGAAPVVVQRAVRHTRTFGEDWAEATTPAEQRAVLDDALQSVVVVRGRVGRGLDRNRLSFHWNSPEDLGPIEAPDDETLARWAEG